jgi:hypothetical protein
MKGWIRRTCVGCVVALALGATSVHASAGGTITFVGAIVMPTCSAGGSMGVSPGSSSGGCGVVPDHSSLPTSSYRQDVVPLERAVVTQDRLLVYFASYAGTADTQMMTRTYE